MAMNPIRGDAARVTLAKTRVNGTTPFYSHPDGVNERINEAHALLTVMARGYCCAQEAGGNISEQFGMLRHEITATAIEGIATLLALALHHRDAAGEE